MPYVDLAGLSRFAGKSKDFASSACAGLDMANWQKTPAAGAVSFSPVPEMPLDPAVNFLFTESGPASGTKGPENPSTIAGVTQAKVTRCGKNLLPRNPVSSVMSQRGITVTYNEDGSIHLKGTATSGYDAYMTYFNNSSLGVVPVVMAAGKILTVSITCSDSNVSGKIYDSNSLTAWGSPVNVSPGTPVTHTMQSDVASAMFRIMVTRGSTVDCDVYCQIEYGQTATEWEAPADVDYTVNLGGTYCGGSVDLSAGTMTVTWVGESINSADHTATSVIQANTIGASYITRYRSYGAAATLTGLVCNKFESMNGDADEEHVRLTGGANGTYTENVYINRSRLDLTGASDPNNPTLEEALAAVNAWLAVNPIFIAYRLFTPFTVSLTPTQIYSLSQIDPYTPRINTVYSDQVSVQVGYPKSPQASQTELTNAIVSLGGNV